jgi:acyl dehydratase
MPIDPSQALGHEFAPATGSWTQDDVILYHLGIGAGVPATDANELEYTYEKNLKVLPSFGVCPVFGAIAGIAGTPGLEFNFAMLLHGEQDIEIHRPLPVAAEIESRGRVAELWDKGKACLAVIELVTSEQGGEPLFTNRFSLFLRGEGGFGGEPGPKAGNRPPDRAPDGSVEKTLLPQQALLYRMSGDKNPLHADPEFAKIGGFDKPIIHGLCSFGITLKAVVDGALGGDVGRVGRYQTRFAGVGFPGETYRISWWNEGDKVLITTTARDRDNAPIITNAAITLT